MNGVKLIGESIVTVSSRRQATKQTGNQQIIHKNQGGLS
jgi:hypothetical protein